MVVCCLVVKCVEELGEGEGGRVSALRKDFCIIISIFSLLCYY